MKDSNSSIESATNNIEEILEIDDTLNMKNQVHLKMSSNIKMDRIYTELRDGL